ncbi:MAG TPA: hypothetical protein VJL58_02075 [Pyrinomonadaceae bacterium]|nr:hypothetical protein [Pyrinomonadaceae bacterium]
MSNLEFLLSSLPDPDSARRFLDQFREKNRGEAAKLEKDGALLSDVFTIVSYSPLLASTLLQNPSYISWLGRQRHDSKVRSKEELLESLARFTLTDLNATPHAAFSRFRRRELMRIFLRDIRRLATVAEITEEISNLADAILDHALTISRQEIDNRFGSPLETDDRGKKRIAEMTIVSLGKLGSKELNYSSDIDLLFMYSTEGATSGTGSRGSVTNREYFVKLAESVIKLVGEQTGEGAAYRVDMRLRPHGRVGPLALSIKDTVDYYINEAHAWERQVLIRSRSSAGDAGLFKEFFSRVEGRVFSKDVTVADALRNVRRSKQLIDENQIRARGFDVKLGKGGIREIEFIAQALQLAYGGKDKWLRVPHTLISISRLADRELIGDRELNDLSHAYHFLRRLEHLLQMEHGLQTHLLSDDPEKRGSIARRMGYDKAGELEQDLVRHRTRVARIFERVFEGLEVDKSNTNRKPVPSTALKVGVDRGASSPSFATIRQADISPQYITSASERFPEELLQAVNQPDFPHRLSALRQTWRSQINMIVDAETSDLISIRTSKRLQTSLAEASIQAAYEITCDELARRVDKKIGDLHLAILGLGKLGSANLDYESDLDVVLVFDESVPVPADLKHLEFYSRAAEIFVSTLSGMTRDGNLYRVDLRLRPYGKNGPSVVSKSALLDYIEASAAVWELLAYLKIRGVGGDIELARETEAKLSKSILTRASKTDRTELATETVKMRSMLETQRAGRRVGEIDIKYGSGGMLDIYFAIRYLQLRDGIADTEGKRTSAATLDVLRERGSVTTDDHTNLIEGYKFLSTFDHYLRLIVGRSTKVPLANTAALQAVANRMNTSSIDELLGQLNGHRLNIRTSYDNILNQSTL